MNVYVPSEMPDIVAEAPIPIVVVPPGELVTIHDPVAGNPLKATLPVARTHVG